jgi:hypothetical protein
MAVPGRLDELVNYARAKTVTNSCLVAYQVIDPGRVVERPRRRQRPLPCGVVIQEVQLGEAYGLPAFFDYEQLSGVIAVDSRAVAAFDRLEVVILAPPRLDVRLRKPLRQQAEIVSPQPAKAQLHAADATNRPPGLLARVVLLLAVNPRRSLAAKRRRLQWQADDSKRDLSMVGTATPEEHRPEVPKDMGLPPGTMLARKRSPEVVFSSLGQQPECVWVSHVEMLPGI